MNYEIDIVETLKRIRKEKNLSIRKLSNISGVHYLTICNIENNKYKPFLDTWFKIARGLMIDPYTTKNIKEFKKINYPLFWEEFEKILKTKNTRELSNYLIEIEDRKEIIIRFNLDNRIIIDKEDINKVIINIKNNYWTSIFRKEDKYYVYEDILFKNENIKGTKEVDNIDTIYTIDIESLFIYSNQDRSFFEKHNIKGIQINSVIYDKSLAIIKQSKVYRSIFSRVIRF